MTFLEIWGIVKSEVIPALLVVITALSPLIITYMNSKGRKNIERLVDLREETIKTNKTLNSTNGKLSELVTKDELNRVVQTVNTIKDILVIGYSNSTLPEEVKKQITTKDLENKLGGNAEVVQELVEEVKNLKEKAAAKVVEEIKTTSNKAIDVVQKSTRIRG